VLILLEGNSHDPAQSANVLMAWKILRKEPDAEAAAPSSDVEFALVLSRMINSVSEDPQHLRASLYELARHKLDEQIAAEGPEEKSRILKSLEVAIQGVETHYSRLELRSLDAPEGHSRLSLPRYQATPRTEAAASAVMVASENDGRRVPPFRRHSPDWGQTAHRGRLGFTALRRYLTVLALAAAVGLAVYQRGNIAQILGFNVRPAAVASKTVSKPAQVPAEEAALRQTEVPPPDATSVIPTTFGVYAVSDGKLYPLELLPGRAPDYRVAISAAISTPSKTALPDRHIRFIVFRRDSATNALERAEVRVIAKIAQAMKFDSAGKPVITKTDDSWVIRNISIPYRTAPLKGQPDMYEVLGEDADKLLEPGRYALILKGEAYDFSVAGEIRDSRQCLESLAAANGAFYTECQKKR
jgi:hypothetical protein